MIRIIIALFAILIGRVVAITDGDTIKVLDNSNKEWKIRLAKIDAPEKSQSYGQEAKKMLSDIVYGKQVTVEYDKPDRYGRLVGIVKTDRHEANLEMVKLGRAWHYTQYDHDPRYAQAEHDAQLGQLGIWSQPNPIPPWEYRKDRHR